MFEKAERKFKNLGKSFTQAQSHATRAQDFVNTLELQVKLISNAIDNATPIKTYENTSALVVTFDYICEEFGELRDTPAY